MKKSSPLFIALGLLLLVANISIFAQTQADSDADRREVFVILDVSGSMNQQNRFTNVQDFLDTEIVDGLLREGDDFTLLTFGERVAERFSRTIRSEADRVSLKAELRGLRANEDFTDIGAAMERTAEILERPERAGTRRVILFITDGFNAPSWGSPFRGADISIDERFRNLGERISRGAWFFYVIGIGGETAAEDVARLVPGSGLIGTDADLSGVDFAERVVQQEEEERRLEEERRRLEARSANILFVIGDTILDALNNLAMTLGLTLPQLLGLLALLLLLLLLLILFIKRASRTLVVVITDGKETLTRKIPPSGRIVLNSSGAILPSLGKEGDRVFRIQRSLFGLKIHTLDSKPIAEKSPYKNQGTHSLTEVIKLANGSQVRIKVN
ncbi:MAG: VWA domain-containing protein [Treponema sp.]|nr:VWA domain-containing protein [Treponema sp.]